MAIKVAVCGALGRMGKEVVKAVHQAPDLELVGGVDRMAADGNTPSDLGAAAGLGEIGVSLVSEISALQSLPDVIVDFTEPKSVLANVLQSLERGMHVVVGTTGLSQADLTRISHAAEAAERGVIIAPNFAIGAVLMMHFAAKAAKFFPHVEIIELHHDQKKDAPSGTAIKTAEMIREARRTVPTTSVGETVETVSGARGGQIDGIHIHSVRLPGLIAHQEVIFGLPGQTLTLRHDSLNRESFMPGVLLAIREVVKMRGLVYGLENLLDL